jgi:RsiW-degrading membrane proteinase PrsW (M82 family)
MPLVIAVVAGILPMTLYPLFLYWMDRYEKEPLPLLFGVFLWGFIPAAILSLISQLILGAPLLLLDETGGLMDALSTIILAPITEEFFKGLAVVAVYLVWRAEFDGVYDGIIYGGLVGFGFAAIENVLYFLDADVLTVLLRAVIFGLNHAFFTSLTGIGLGVARHARSGVQRIAAPLLGLLAAMAAHAIHNASVSFAGEAPALLCLALVTDWGGVLFVLLVMVFAIRRERQWIIDELRDEIALNTLTEGQYRLVGSPVQRASTRLSALLTRGPAAWARVGRYFHTLTELAYKKHARSRRGDAGATTASIEALRARAAALSGEHANL